MTSTPKLFQTLSILSFTFLLATIAQAQVDDHDDHDDHDEHHDDHEDHESNASTILAAIGITTFAGCAAFLGFFSIFCIKKEQIGAHLMSSSLAFSSGVIVHLSFINLYPECVEQLEASTNHSPAMAHFYTLLCVIGGILIALGMEALFKHFNVDPHHHHHHDPRVQPTAHDAQGPTSNVPNQMVAQTSNEAPTQEDGGTKAHDIPELSHLSYSVAIALILHHFPEGIATFVSLYHDLEFGVLVAFALALHDIPSGICISVPLYCATGSKLKPFYLCAIAAAVYPVGALIGWLIIETASDIFIDRFIGVLFGITGGIMLYIAFVELLPAAIVNANRLSAQSCENRDGTKRKDVMTIAICCFFAGLLIMNVSHILLLAVGGHSH